MMQVLELLRLAKSTFPDEATLNSEEIKPAAIAIIELRLSDGISQSVSQSVKSVENCVKKEIFIISYQLHGRVYHS